MLMHSQADRIGLLMALRFAHISILGSRWTFIPLLSVIGIYGHSDASERHRRHNHLAYGHPSGDDHHLHGRYLAKHGHGILAFRFAHKGTFPMWDA